jgi:hypothetical protein
LGTWGEWHTYPREDLFASKAVQREVMDAYEAAFHVTPVLLRYPAGENDPQKEANADRKFGYHDDSFAWATLHTGKRGDEWFYLTALKAAGRATEAKWQTQPIGGEIRPEAWGQVFDEQPELGKIQDISECVESTHVTWLMDSGIFKRAQSADRIARAGDIVRRMGYEFSCTSVTISDVNESKVAVSLEIKNRGVAPFYYDWKSEWGLFLDGQLVKTIPASGKLIGLLPNHEPRDWADTLDLSGLKAGQYVLAVRVVNPLKGGKPLRFANRTQDAHAAGWLSLGEVEIPQ